MAKKFLAFHLPFLEDSQDFHIFFPVKENRGWQQGIWEGAKRPRLGIIPRKALRMKFKAGIQPDFQKDAPPNILLS